MRTVAFLVAPCLGIVGRVVLGDLLVAVTSEVFHRKRLENLVADLVVGSLFLAGPQEGGLARDV